MVYWELDRVICERQADGTGWGKAVVEQLAADLRVEFPGIPQVYRGIFGSGPLADFPPLPRLAAEFHGQSFEFIPAMIGLTQLPF